MKHLHSLILILILLPCLSTTLHSTPLAATTPPFDYTITPQHQTLTLTPGTNTTTPLYINLTTNTTGTVTLQGTWTNTTPTTLTATIQPRTHTAPFTSRLTITATIDTPPGTYHYHLNATSTTNHTLNLTINITTNTNITLTTDKPTYQKGQTIHINGTATPTDTTPLTTGTVTLIFTTTTNNITLTTPLHNTTYNLTYPISYGDNDGPWTLQARITDNHGHIGIHTTHITVTIPQNTIRYSVDFYSPPNHAIYRRGDTLAISVYTTENTQSITNATTTCTLPTQTPLTLTEYTPGNYQHHYTIPYNEPLGDMTLTVQTTKNTTGTLHAGGATLTITIQPAPLQIIIRNLTTTPATTTTTINLTTDVRYPDHTKMTTGTITATTAQGTTTLHPTTIGDYTATITNATFTGNQIITIVATDPYGNTATIKKVLTITTPLPQTSPLASIIPVLAAGACCLISIVCIFQFYKGQHLRNIRSEMKVTKQLKEDTGRKYYVEGSISKEVYDTLMYDHVQRYTQLRKEEQRLLDNKKISDHLNHRHL